MRESFSARRSTRAGRPQGWRSCRGFGLLALRCHQGPPLGVSRVAFAHIPALPAFNLLVRERLGEIRSAEADALVVTQSRPEAVSAASLPLPTVCDPDRTAYRYFGLDGGRWSMFFRRKVLAHYLRLIFTGWRPRPGVAGEDMLKLGGDFVLSADRRLVCALRCWRKSFKITELWFESSANGSKSTKLTSCEPNRVRRQDRPGARIE